MTNPPPNSTTISVICANDSLELAFPPDTSEEIILAEKARIKNELDKRYPDNHVYVHLHTVSFYQEKEKNET